MTATQCALKDMRPMQPEYVILVDRHDRQVGIAEKLQAHEKNWLHRAFSVALFRYQGTKREFLLQQRASHKYHSPGLWTNACCSHPRPGELVVPAGERRLKEELGMQVPLKNIGWFYYNAHFENGLSEHEIDHVLAAEMPMDTAIRPDPNEIKAVRWVEMGELDQELTARPETFTPWLPQVLAKVKADWM
jgi:isopentenyl-diphosphate delta-isomerase